MQRSVITYSKNIFLPLTHVCANECEYCCFRTPVTNDCVMSPSSIIETIRRGASMGVTEALFTFGERPGRVKGFSGILKAKTGYNDILDYCYDMCLKSIEYGILPHTNAGILTYEEMEQLKEVNASMGLMLETTADIKAHARSPGKKPAVRIEMMENAGKLRIPFTTGILLGIGETFEDREDSLRVIRDLHMRYGHIQEVIIQNFTPKPGTPMAEKEEISFSEMGEMIRLSREILQDDIAIQIPPNLANAGELIGFGVDDLGGVSPLTIDYVNPEHPWPEIEELKEIAGNDVILKERLCIYPKYIKMGWYSPILRALIEELQEKISGVKT